MQGLLLAAQIEGDEMAQMGQGDLAPQLQFEGNGPFTVRAGQLPHLDHKILGFGAGENQFTAYRKVIVSFGQSVAGARLFGLLGQGARLPDAHHLEMQLTLFPGAGINHPEMGQG